MMLQDVTTIVTALVTALLHINLKLLALKEIYISVSKCEYLFCFRFKITSEERTVTSILAQEI
mgnify:CR=1